MPNYQIWYREKPDAGWKCLHHPENEGGSVVNLPSHEEAERWRLLTQERLPLGEVEIRETSG
ncbi:hypothetical protein [Deinococcus peraridilitoris]|nr:hypothetical protein [Deinococcus peraridilitoris]